MNRVPVEYEERIQEPKSIGGFFFEFNAKEDIIHGFEGAPSFMDAIDSGWKIIVRGKVEKNGDVVVHIPQTEVLLSGADDRIGLSKEEHDQFKVATIVLAKDELGLYNKVLKNRYGTCGVIHKNNAYTYDDMRDILQLCWESAEEGESTFKEFIQKTFKKIII